MPTKTDETSADRLPAPPEAQEPIRVGISRCLLGEPVRYDGGHKRDRLVTESLGRCFDWVPVCPEVEIGMGTPREPIHLVQWVERVFAYHRLQALWSRRWRLGELVAFHTAHKLTLLAHSTAACRRLGRLLAAPRALPRDELRRRYEAEFMGALARRASPGRHVKVLEHMAGHFKDAIDDAARRELGEHIEDYRRGLVPLGVPLTLVKHYVRRLDVACLRDQAYLNPHPKELMLRNGV